MKGDPFAQHAVTIGLLPWLPGVYPISHPFVAGRAE